ncbi:MAG: SH3 domain-containing protein [Clostridium sp.]|nr:SH3 domain-containing protein [Clostridium sp.]
MNKNKIAKILATTAIASGLIVVATDSVEAKAQVTKDVKNDVSEKVEDIKKGQVVNVNSNVRIRENANEDSKVIGYLTNGQEVEIIGETKGWYQIKSNDVKGYIKFDYIKVLSDTNIVTGTVVNISTTLSVRETSDVLGKELAKLTNGTKLIVIGEEDSWYKIKYENLVGYVYKDYVKVNKENTQIENNFESVQERAISKTKGTVTGVNTSLNVRSGASTSASIIGTLKNGAKVDITGESGNWYKINYSGKVGYVSKDYVKKGTTPQSQPKPEEKPQTETKVTGTVTGIKTTLNIRSGASTSASIIGTLKNGAKVEITGESGNWYKINYNGKVGYVYKSYIKKGTTGTTGGDGGTSTTTEKKGVVVGISTTLNVRSGASTSASIIGTLRNGAQVTIIGESGNWYKIKFNERVGYVSKDYVREGNSNDGQGQVIRATFENVYAVMSAHIGSPYVWGGAGEYLTSSLLYTLSKRFPADAANGAYSRAWQYVDQGYRAFDCSGLMQWGYAQVGIKIGRTTWDQITCGTEVSLNNLKPGDLLFNTSLTHVGMYIGNGQWIESPNRSANVRVTAVPWGSIGRARRVLK